MKKINKTKMTAPKAKKKNPADSKASADKMTEHKRMMRDWIMGKKVI